MTTPQMSVYFFLQAAVILLVCRLVGLLARRLGQPQVVGEMIAGVALGPSLFGALLPDLQQALFPKPTLDMLYVAAQFGVGLYMFLVGTDFRGDHFRTRYRSAMGVSLAGIAVPFVLAFVLAPWLLHVPGLFSTKTKLLEASLFLGAAIAITAFPDAGADHPRARPHRQPAGHPGADRRRGRRRRGLVHPGGGAGQLRRQLGQRLSGDRRRRGLCAVHAAGRPPLAAPPGRATCPPTSR